ncbi:hypothetical protein KAR91_21195 [Candidatus Pacearchaeota archaeon]|nr:hypothetical protein [Candidatus Pacearchaeota archaeon]
MTTVNQVSQLAKALVDADADIKAMDDKLKKAKERSRYLREESIPTMMQELDLESLTLSTGQKLTIKSDVHASITEENKVKAFGWLEDNGHGGLIKSVVKVEFGRGELEAAGHLVTELQANGVDPEFKEHVHPTTLKAFLREEIRQGRKVPMGLFNARPVLIAKIK